MHWRRETVVDRERQVDGTDTGQVAESAVAVGDGHVAMSLDGGSKNEGGDLSSLFVHDH